jgi:uncharacterized membrane protein
MKINRIFGVMCVALMFILSALAYPYMGERVPIHWNLQGEIDGWGSPFISLLITPLLGVVMLLLLTYLPKFDPIRKDYTPFIATIKRWNNAILLYFTLIHAFVLAATVGWAVPMPQLVIISAGVLMAFLGNEMRRLEPNSFYGIRLPWTLTNPQVWRESHRIGGRLFFIGGVLMALTGLFPVGVGTMIAFMGILFTMLIATIGYSWWVARRVA